jgi:uncharacterized protein (DUF608 family)
MHMKITLALLLAAAAAGAREFNGPYEAANLNRVAFPIGGLGAGMYCLEGYGAISAMSVRHKMEFFNEPTCFAAVCVLGESPEQNVARVLEGPIPDWKYFGQGGSGNGASGRTYGFPRFRQCAFAARFPFATVSLRDAAVPLAVELTGWSPFTPPDADSSSLPAGALEYRFTNASDKPVRAVFSFNARNFMGDAGAIGPLAGGFALYAKAGEGRDASGAFACFVDAAEVAVDHCWFRGGWWDPLTLAWNNVASGRAVSNPPVPDRAPGASLAVPFALKPGEARTIRLNTCWHVPGSGLKYGKGSGAPDAPAFRQSPSKGATSGQQPVTGFLGKGLVNTFDPDGDTPQGTLTSPEFSLAKRYVHFLIGGGALEGRTCVNLLVGGKVVLSATGKGKEALEWATFDVAAFQGQKGRVQLVDRATEGWGHINADHFVLSDEPLAALRQGEGNALVADAGRAAVLADFEGESYGAWEADPPAAKKACACEGGACGPDSAPATYVPWYATKYKSVQEVAAYWRAHAAELRARSERFRDAFYDTTLPPEAVEAVAANLTILKSPTMLRQHDGRLWCWEGCSDGSGCCPGSCAHVWNYAQAVCHLFPSLERGMRETAFFEGQDEKGRQAFRVNLPITPGGGMFDASDGHLGEIMKAHREWRVSGDAAWLKRFWPRIQSAMAYAIRTWDPRETGLLEESHHNTYDINYFGPDGHCGSFYLGALAAAARMAEALGEDAARYRALLAKGRARMEKELFNGEYFIQIVEKEGLDSNFPPLNPDEQSEAYREVARQVNEQGPKYQYGTVCLSDGVLGLWMARACGVEEELVDPAKVKSHLLAVYTHNLKRDLSTHANPQRPSYAMGDDGGLLLCSWPRGGKPLLPFVYSDEVWTGIEYQVAAHLMMLGEVEKGLEIVRVCRKRYDGVRRNPFNEYECGHWYARALSSYALLEALSGVRYDAVDKALRVRTGAPAASRSFLCTDTGFGTATVKGGKAAFEEARE